MPRSPAGAWAGNGVFVAFPLARAASAASKASILQARPLRGPITLMVGNNLPCPLPRDSPAIQGPKRLWGVSFPTGDLLAEGWRSVHLQLGWRCGTGGHANAPPILPSWLWRLAGRAQQQHTRLVPLPGLPGALPSPGTKAAQTGAVRHPRVLSLLPWLGPGMGVPRRVLWPRL